MKLTSEESSSPGRGRHRGRRKGRGRGHGRGRHLGNEEEKEKKTFDKSSIQCYNCQKYGHFGYECRNPKREREDRAYVANSAPTLAQTPQALAPVATSSLLMAIEEARSDFLLQGSEIDHHTSDMWYLDTGTTNHITGQRNFFTTLDELADDFVKFGDNSRVEIKGRGSVVVLRQDGQRLSFGNVLFVPKLCANILSLGRLDEEGCKMTMFGGRLTIHDWDGALLAEVHRTEGRLYLLKLKVEDNCLPTKADDNSSRLWHLRYGHLNYHLLKKMATKNLVEGLLPITLPTQLCHSCLAGKQSRIPFPKMIVFRANAPLELVFTDICCPISPPTLGRSQYFLLIVDDYSRLMWVAMMKLKSQALSHFQKFNLLAEAEKGVKIQCLRTDRGGEFNSDEFTLFCVSHGIKR